MSAPPLTAPAPGPAPAPLPETGRRSRSHATLVAVLACFALATLSLLLPSEPTYDPWAWLIWGREIVEGNFVTTAGPSWKPLPVFFTVPFALFGDAAPNLWLIVARAGGLLALLGAFRLGRRLAGPAAGVIAVVSLVFAQEFVRHFARGNSEGLLVATGLWAVDRHLSGRRHQALLLLFAAALLRPEIWAVFGAYGVWLGWRGGGSRMLIAGLFAATGVLWFVPEYIGSGDFFRAATRALEPVPGSAGASQHPFLEVFVRMSRALTLPVLLAAAAMTLVSALRLRRRRARQLDEAVLGLAAASIVLVVVVAAMSKMGFTGNIRYAALPAGMVSVLAGAGCVLAVRAARARVGAAGGVVAVMALAALFAPYVVHETGDLRAALRAVGSEAHFYENLDVVLARTGGAAAANACGRIVTGPYETQALAWRLHRPPKDIMLEGGPPGTVFAARGSVRARDARFPEIFRTERWMVRRTCST